MGHLYIYIKTNKQTNKRKENKETKSKVKPIKLSLQCLTTLALLAANWPKQGIL